MRGRKLKILTVCLALLLFGFILEGCGYWASLYDAKPIEKIIFSSDAQEGNNKIKDITELLSKEGFSVSKQSVSASTVKTVFARKPSIYIYVIETPPEEIKLFLYPSRISMLRSDKEDIDSLIQKLQCFEIPNLCAEQNNN